MFPAKGVTASGEVVSGYYPEVSGDGTLILRGPSMDERIYESALKQFAMIGRRYNVVTLQRGSYIKERDTWRLNDKPSMRDGGTMIIQEAQPKVERASVEDRLKKLKSLRQRSVISQEEYERARSEILSDL